MVFYHTSLNTHISRDGIILFEDMVIFPSRLVTFPRCSLPQFLVQWENQDIDQFEVSGPHDIVGKKVEIHLFTVEVNAIHFFTNSSKQLERHEYSTLFHYANPCIIQSIFLMKVLCASLDVLMTYAISRFKISLTTAAVLMILVEVKRIRWN